LNAEVIRCPDWEALQHPRGWKNATIWLSRPIKLSLAGEPTNTLRADVSSAFCMKNKTRGPGVFFTGEILGDDGSRHTFYAMGPSPHERGDITIVLKQRTARPVRTLLRAAA